MGSVCKAFNCIDGIYSHNTYDKRVFIIVHIVLKLCYHKSLF